MSVLVTEREDDALAIPVCVEKEGLATDAGFVCCLLESVKR